MATIQDLIDTFTESDLTLTVPLDVQDVSSDDLEMVNTYNAYLAAGDYDAANTYRNENTDIEKYIFDVKKINMLQTFIMNAYLYAKNQGQQCVFSKTEPVEGNDGSVSGQIEDDIWFEILGKDDNGVVQCKSYMKQADGTYQEFDPYYQEVEELIIGYNISNVTIAVSDWSNANTTYIINDNVTENSVIDIYFNDEMEETLSDIGLTYKQGNGYILLTVETVPSIALVIDTIIINNSYTEATCTVSSSV